MRQRMRRPVQHLIERPTRRGIRSAVPPGALVHALRHSFATLALEHGADVAEVCGLLGHASLATTSRYLDAAESRGR
jgi:site-specific recombinase XerD